ncbi:MAG: FHA domain-containing protein [Cyanobacteriota bacterium]|nr:FHA domain-containing protein [Cyanobacteriota bacterium]
MAFSDSESGSSPETMLSILVVDDDTGRRAIKLQDSTYALGRDPSNSIILHSPSVSRQHALLVGSPNLEKGGYSYKILDGNTEGKRSKNGISVNSIKCFSQELKDGDLIEFAPQIQARFYMRMMTESDIQRYTQSASFHSIKSSPRDGVETFTMQDRSQPALILDPKETEPCTIKLPKQSALKLGVKYKNMGFYFERFFQLELREAINQVRHRLENPQDPRELCIFLEDPSGYRLCIYQPQLEMLPYERILTQIMQKMREPGQVPIADRRWGLRVFKKCFLGSDAVTWLAEYLHGSRSEAVRLGQDCLNKGYFHHVMEHSIFVDDKGLYHFSQGGGSEPRVNPLR